MFSVDFRVEADDTRPPHRVRGLPRPALLRFPRLLPVGMGPEPRRRDGRNGSGETELVAQILAMQTLVWPDADEAELLGGAARQVEHAALDERPAIVDADDDAAAVALLVTFSLVPNGRLRCAAVMAAGFMRSPEAVANAAHTRTRGRTGPMPRLSRGQASRSPRARGPRPQSFLFDHFWDSSVLERRSP